MKISEITEYITSFASEKHQYPWDNSGYQTGDGNTVLTGILLCVDCLSDVVDEAIEKNCNLIISHHPLLFSGMKRITDDYKSRIIRKLIKNDITVYSSHTAFDVCDDGMNGFVAQKLGLENIRYLDDLSEMKCRYFVSVFRENEECVKDIISGCGSFSLTENDGGKTLTFSATAFTADYHKICSKIKRQVPSAEIYSSPIISGSSPTGLGVTGELKEKKSAQEVISQLKEIFECETVKVSRNYKNKKVKTVSICTGSGGDYLKTAMRSGADLYVCADLKWNDFLVCEESGLTAVCPTHFESEKSFMRIMASKLKELDESLRIYESDSADIETFL